MKVVSGVGKYLVALGLLTSPTMVVGAPTTPTPNPMLQYLDPRGKVDLTICSQNLENLASSGIENVRFEKLTDGNYREKVEALINRFEDKRCDVIAVQEVVGKQELKAKSALTDLALLLRERVGRTFDTLVAPGNDTPARVGFLYARDQVEILNTLSFSRVELPKIAEKQKPRFFTRSPLEVQMKVKGREEAESKIITFVNIHFKSKSGGQDDPALLEWETQRMEMAEALRRIILNRHKESYSTAKTLLVVLGDRNANWDVATAKILEGRLALRNFQEGGGCRLSKRGLPLCITGKESGQTLFSVLTTDPQTKLLGGSYVYRGVNSWIDDILMPQPTLRFALTKYDEDGDYNSGTYQQYPEASDHHMIYVRLNW
jgi:endonuclease/exonuclease/phosphatase family metal-dependent hydrolase